MKKIIIIFLIFLFTSCSVLFKKYKGDPIYGVDQKLRKEIFFKCLEIVKENNKITSSGWEIIIRQCERISFHLAYGCVDNCKNQ